MSDPIVIQHIAEDGFTYVLFTEGVTVYTVDENCPTDRVFRHSGTNSRLTIMQILGDDPVGFIGDNSGKDEKAHATIAKMEGRPHLSVVSDKDREPPTNP